MTERPLSITTQIATPIQATLNSAASVSANDALPATESLEEEPYTIKCICDYYDDDGNTIYCEKCDTWQHIECFYPGRVDDASREEFDHSCADCKPRPLDRRHATERQRQQRQNKLASDGTSERKGKRPPSKSHKKKMKPSELQVNGVHDHDGHKNGSPHENHHPHPKKTKGHRASQSLSSVKRSPPFHARQNSHAHPPSPAHTPPDLPQDFQVHSYSDSFLRLYDDEDAVQRNPTNSFASLSVTNSMSSWLRDSESLQKDTGIKDKDEVFQYLKLQVHTLKWPELVVDRKDATLNDAALSWRYLTTPTALPHSGRIGELNGLVGFQKDYCEDMENKWIEMAHPRPLIFFHPRLPLFIDTRHEGSICRYVRRSCRANTILETFIASGSEYHFWLVSERPLRENEQITLPWDFRFPSHLRSRYLHLLNLGDDDGTPFDGSGISDAEYDQLTATISLVLSDHGGCACDLGNDCAFARFHRNYHGRSHGQSNGVKSKKGRKPKQHHVSPSSTGHATNSRAASEGHPEHGDDEDNRSVSGSSRSKPQSRDMTPLHGVGETNGITQEPSDREKRKLAMVEDTFRKMEQGQPPRKKKRASDGSTMGSAGNSTTPQPPKARKGSIAPRTSVSQPPTSAANHPRARQYVDASTSRRQSGSPFSAASPTTTLPSPDNLVSRNASTPNRSRQASAVPKSIYADSSTQTDEVDNAWWKQSKPKTSRTVVPLAKRLLKNRSRIRAQQESQVNEAVAMIKGTEEQPAQISLVVPMDLDTVVHEEHALESPTDSKDRKVSISSSTPSVEISCVDVNMTEAPAIVIGNSIKPPPPPWPGQPNNTARRGSSPSQKSPDLRVQMPPTPAFTTPTLNGPLSGSVTPSSATGSISQSPLGTVHYPSAFATSTVNGIGQHSSPIKTTKKLSLSDYKASRMKRNESSNAVKPAEGSSPTTALAALKSSLSTIEESKSNHVLDSSAIADTPMREKSVDPLASAPKAPASSGQTNGTL
ncbi:FYVE zinc finger [Venustampulla echinocandica]|uniref:FYVE zinc finger n=1 Tax=Venustampulla echinocandica TaxID=2656787 RepID=A0A370TFI7_9HELO|nr:FYVE zinc finger [Venustampulla echinocandica]RDL33662.1 FYVE zinc finger [Venustampulla echinocandica]